MIHGSETAQHLARESALAYDPHADGIRFDNDTCHCVVRRDAAGNIIVAFRGTEDADDWLSNLKKAQTCWHNLRVHSGFANALAPLMSDIRIAVGELHHMGNQVWVCGHSRGGAHALLASVAFEKLNIRVAGCYTYGCPRVGDSDFAAWCDDNLPGHHRYVYQSDIFARLPISGYRHCGKLHWHNGREWADSMPWWTRMGAYMFARRWPLIGDSASDHSIGHYIGALQ